MNAHRHNPAGSSLVELLAAMVAASVLALCFGSMLVFFHRSWQRNSTAVALERDAVAALDVIERHLRPLSSGAVTVHADGLVLDTGGGGESFRVAGRDLRFDPDTSRTGDEHRLIAGRVEQFVSTPFQGGLTVLLGLADGDERVVLQSSIRYRNTP